MSKNLKSYNISINTVSDMWPTSRNYAYWSDSSQGGYWEEPELYLSSQGSSFHFTRWEKKITSSGNTDVLLMYQMTVIVLIPQSNVLFLKNCAGERKLIQRWKYISSQSDSLLIRHENEEKKMREMSSS